MNTTFINETDINYTVNIEPKLVHDTLRKYMLVDGFDFVLDLRNSHGSTFIDERNGDEYIDFFSFFASSPLGMNHPKLSTPEFRQKVSDIALNKPSNSDIFTTYMAEFVDAFGRIAKPAHFKYLFFVSGGSVGVENGLKVAFDWKVQKNFKKGYKEEKGHQVIHFKEAFHGRTGYTLSLTNTDPNKVNYFPKFPWPRIDNPKITFPLEQSLSEVIKAEEKAVDQIYAAIKQNKDDIAVIILEPIQAEGGDNYFRKEFFLKLRQIADENEILLMFDEVQTGMGITGKMWASEHYVYPDIISFGKKAQTCGIMVSDRIDDVEEHCFRKPSRINSTWGGNLIDMARAGKYLEIYEEENILDNVATQGEFLINRLQQLQKDFPTLVSNARGKGLMCAFDMPNGDIRKEFLSQAHKQHLIILGCGNRSIRFRTPLNITQNDLNKGLKIIENVLFSLRNK